MRVQQHFTRSIATIVTVVVTSCGGASPVTRTSASAEPPLDPDELLLEIGQASSIGDLFEPPPADAEEIEAQLESAAEGERDALIWDLVRARLALLEEAAALRRALESEVEEAITERAAVVQSLMEARAERTRLAREEAEQRRAEEAAEREREQASAARAQAESRAEARARAASAPDSSREVETTPASVSAESASGETPWWLRREVDSSAPRPRSTPNESERERLRAAHEEEFRRRAERAQRARERRARGDEKTSSPKQSSYRQRRRARRRRLRRRSRRARPRPSPGDEAPSALESQPAGPPDEGVLSAQQDLERLHPDDRAEFITYIDREREARRRLQAAERSALSARSALTGLNARFRGTQLSRTLQAKIAFAAVWASWRTGSDEAEALAESFTEDHPGSGDLLALAWMIRGELAAMSGDIEASLAAFRFGMNRLGEPIYAYSLWRSATIQRDAGDTTAARETLHSLELEGCSSEAPELVRRLARAGARELGHALVVGEDGHTRSEACPDPSARDETGWRPEE